MRDYGTTGLRDHRTTGLRDYLTGARQLCRFIFGFDKDLGKVAALENTELKRRERPGSMVMWE